MILNFSTHVVVLEDLLVILYSAILLARKSGAWDRTRSFQSFAWERSEIRRDRAKGETDLVDSCSVDFASKSAYLEKIRIP